MFLVTPQLPAIDLLKTFDAARQQAGLTWDRVADLLLLRPQQLYQQLRGVGHLSWTRMFGMAREEDGRRFLRAYLPLVAEAAGLGELAEGLRFAEVLRGMLDRFQASIGTKSQMVKAEVRESIEQRKVGA